MLGLTQMNPSYAKRQQRLPHLHCERETSKLLGTHATDNHIGHALTNKL